MSPENFITEERDNAPLEDLLNMLTETLEMIENGEEPCIIVMRATPSDSPDYSAIDLFVRCPDEDLLRGMFDTLTEWEAKHLPPKLKGDAVGGRN